MHLTIFYIQGFSKAAFFLTHNVVGPETERYLLTVLRLILIPIKIRFGLLATMFFITALQQTLTHTGTWIVFPLKNNAINQNYITHNTLLVTVSFHLSLRRRIRRAIRILMTQILVLSTSCFIYNWGPLQNFM